MWDFDSAEKIDATQPKKKKPKLELDLHLRRIGAEIKLGGGLGSAPIVYRARLFFNDFHPEALRLYSTQPLAQGLFVSVTIQDDVPIYLRAEIEWCKLVARDLLVIRDQRFDYRIQLRYLFDSENEKQALRNAARRFNEKTLLGGIEVLNQARWEAA